MTYVRNEFEMPCFNGSSSVAIEMKAKNMLAVPTYLYFTLCKNIVLTVHKNTRITLKSLLFSPGLLSYIISAP
jgi:hypothetical protein